MSPLRRPGRCTVTAATTSLLLLGCLLQAPTASAAPVDGQASATSILVATPAGCTTDSEGTPTSAPVTGANRTRLTSSEEGMVTQDTDTTQTATARASSDGYSTTVLAGGEVRSIVVGGTLRASLTSTMTADSLCRVLLQTSLSTRTDVTVTRAGWATLRVQNDAQDGVVSASLGRDGTDVRASSRLEEARGAASSRAYLTPGTYDLLLQMQLNRSTASSTTPAQLGSVSAAVRSSYAFTLAGAALGPTRGTGTAVATLDAAVPCGSPRVGVRWKKLAGRAELATVKVNGKVVRTVRNPRPGKRVIIGVPATGRVTVSVTVRDRTATRSYEACR